MITTFTDDVAKTTLAAILAAILEQRGLNRVRSV